MKYKLKSNKAHKTYTIRAYSRGECVATYRSNPQGEAFREARLWTQDQIRDFLAGDDYFEVK